MNFFRSLWNKIYERYVDFVGYNPSDTDEFEIREYGWVNCRCNPEPKLSEGENMFIDEDGNPVATCIADLEKLKEERNNSEPDYYACNGLSPLQAFKQGLLSKEEYIGFCKGNVIKYTVRAGKKDNAVEDIHKAIDYLQHLEKVVE